MLAMLAATTQIVQAFNYGLIAAGIVALLLVAGRWTRKRTWRNPLARAITPMDGPSPAATVVVLVAFLALFQIIPPMLGVRLDTSPEPGSDAWHDQQTAGLVTYAAVSVGMFALLVFGRRARAERPRARRGLSFAVVGLVVLLPIMNAQAEMGRIIWEHLHADVPPPQHVVLRAMHQSEWGDWGRAQLMFGAIVMAPIVEELFFRGVLLGMLCTLLRRAWVPIVLTAVAFGLMHMQQPQDVLPLTTMGIVLGFVRIRCGALWPCILLHGLFNARTMFSVLLAPELLRASG